MNKNILKTASVLSACLFFVTACGDGYTDKDKKHLTNLFPDSKPSKKKQDSFDKALPRLRAFKETLNSTKCPAPEILGDLKERWELDGPLNKDNFSSYDARHGADIKDMAKLLEAHNEIAEFKKLELEKGDERARDAAIKEALTKLIDKVGSLKNLEEAAKKLHNKIAQDENGKILKVLFQAVQNFAEDKEVLALANSLPATTNSLPATT